ncbi:MAG: hypothetical protein ACE5FA_11555, partial [Dehalococcoidia bacterium]
GGLPSGPYSVDGVGDMSIDMQWADGADQLRIAMGMGWLANLVVPANDGCPSGTATVTVEDWTFNAAYDGVGGYAWELFQGASKVDQGSEVLLCTVPAN